jgi:hypothetical protein
MMKSQLQGLHCQKVHKKDLITSAIHLYTLVILDYHARIHTMGKPLLLDTSDSVC